MKPSYLFLVKSAGDVAKIMICYLLNVKGVLRRNKD